MAHTFDLLQPLNESLDEATNTVAILTKALKVEWEPGKDIQPGSMAAHWFACTQTGQRCQGRELPNGRQFACFGQTHGPFVVVHNPYRYPIADSWRLQYYQWLANESPFADIFLTKNPEAIDKFGALLHWDKHVGLAFGGAIAIRTLSEHYRHGVVWADLVKEGVHPTFAYMLAMCWRVDSEKYLNAVYTPVHHGGIDPYSWDKAACIRWLRHQPLETESKKVADATFTTVMVSGLLDIPHKAYDKVVEGRFSANKVVSLQNFVKYWSENWVAFAKKNFDIDYSGGVKDAVVFKIKNPNEPEFDL